MIDKPSPEPKDEPGADARFDALVKKVAGPVKKIVKPKQTLKGSAP